MNEYDAKHVSLEVNGKEIFGFSDDDCSFPDDWSFPKDNSKENQAMLLQDFKRRLSQPLGPDEVPFFNISYKQIPERDY